MGQVLAINKCPINIQLTAYINAIFIKKIIDKVSNNHVKKHSDTKGLLISHAIWLIFVLFIPFTVDKTIPLHNNQHDLAAVHPPG
jgi:hypothetical protein